MNELAKMILRNERELFELWDSAQFSQISQFMQRPVQPEELHSFPEDQKLLGHSVRLHGLLRFREQLMGWNIPMLQEVSVRSEDQRGKVTGSESEMRSAFF